MADKPPSVVTLTLEEALDVIQELCEVSVLRDQLLRKVKKIFGEDALSGNGITLEKREEIEKIIASLKVRKVRRIRSSSYSVLGSLRASRIGCIYRKHLKKHYLIRLLVQWVWRVGYPVYINHINIYIFNRKEKRWRKLIKLREFVKINNKTIFKLADSAVINAPDPAVFPVKEQKLLSTSEGRYEFPEVFSVSINKSKVYGGTNLILVEEEVICHDLYDFNRDYTSDELHGRSRVCPKKNCIRWLAYDSEPESIDEAAAFTDSCATNYAHWLTEVLPRIVLFCQDEEFINIPIIVDDGLHKNIMESLYLAVGDSREIIILSIGRALNVGTLHLTSVAGYVPFGKRENSLTGHSHGKFSPPAFEMLREYFLAERVMSMEKANRPEKIFIRRNSGARKIVNIDELEGFLVDRGYVVVEPEKLSFLHQVQLFRDAKEIVSATGAALANAIFCKPDTHVVILMGKHEDMIYRYWCNMLVPIKLKVSYILGEIVQNQDLGIHGDFRVETFDIADLLESRLNK